MQVAAGALGHNADHAAADGLLQSPSKVAEVVSGESPTTAEVVHREIGQHADGLSILGVDQTQDRELGIDGACRAGDIWALVTRVHHGAHGCFTEGIRLHPVGAPDPSAAVGEGVRIDLGMAHFRWAQLCMRIDDGLRHLRDHLLRVGLVLSGAETHRHRAGCGVRVGGGDEEAICGDLDLFRDERLDRIANIRRKHAGIDHAERHRFVAGSQDQRTGKERIIHPVPQRLDEPPVANGGQFLGRDVNGGGSGLEFGGGR